MNFFHKNKLWLFVAFLATVAVVSSRLDFNRTTVDSSSSNQLKEDATILNKSPLFPKRDQTTISGQTTETPAIETSGISKKQASGFDELTTSTEKFVHVLRVIDGDTIVVDINSLPVHVRLIGINSPEPNDKRARVACLAQRAKEEAEKLLGGQKAELEKDPTQGDYDKYNRLLAYVFLPADSTSPAASSTNFNKLMIENGYAYEYTYFLPYKYQSEFRDAQNKARAAQKGLWNQNTCKN